MSLALPLPRERYVQYLRTQPDAPRREPARTHEVKGKKRHGEGVAYRLYGPHAVVLGRWSVAMTANEKRILDDQYQEGDRENPWGRLIRPEEIDAIAAQIADEKFREGWNPPAWHWRWYLERIQILLNNVGLANVSAYNLFRWTPRRFLRLIYDRLKMRLFGRFEDPYVPFQVGGTHDASEDAEGLVS